MSVKSIRWIFHSRNRNIFAHGRLNSLPRNFLCTFREEHFTRKNIGTIKEWVFANVCRNDPFCQRSLHIVSLNKKIIWLKFLFTSLLKAKKRTYLLLNKGLSYLSEQSNWKFRIIFCKMFTKNFWEFSKLANLCKKFQKLWNCETVL